MFGVPFKNLGLFSAVYIGALAVSMAILFWLRVQFDFDAGSTGTWIASFAASCIVAGQSYAKSSNWTWSREDRRNLAMAYAAASSVIGLVLAIPYMAFDPRGFGELASFWGLFILVFGGLFGTLISYALARFLLGRVVRQKNPQAQ